MTALTSGALVEVRTGVTEFEAPAPTHFVQPALRSERKAENGASPLQRDVAIEQRIDALCGATLPARLAVRYNHGVFRVLTVAWMSIGAIALAGCFDERTFPEPAQMCETLVQVCGEPVLWDYSHLERCYEVGRAGVEDVRQEDQCFAHYDECLSDCEYYGYWLSYYDAGATTNATDAGGTEDGEAPMPGDAGVDAATRD